MENPLQLKWLEAAPRRARWLIGVSGGADSVALLHLMVVAGFRNLVVCHLNHRLRGRASAGDARFVRSLAKHLGLQCEIAMAHLDLESGEGSLETIARHARHVFFSDCARKWKCRRLILAHHADDQAETVLWNLLRGSHGLKGMEMRKEIRIGRINLEIHRPLLEARRSHLTEWLVKNHLTWREDATNSMPFTIRNRLRGEVIPLLDAISGRDATAALVALATDAHEAREICNWALEQANVLDPSGKLHIPALKQLPVALQKAALADFLRRQGIEISRLRIARCLELLEVGGPSRTNLTAGAVLRRRAGRLWIEG